MNTRRIRAIGLLLSEALWRNRLVDTAAADAAETALAGGQVRLEDPIRRAHASGVSVHRIHRATGLSRFAIGRVLVVPAKPLVLSD